MLKIPDRYRSVFMSNMTHFNRVQETVMDKALLSSDSLVVCAPTGSGKTAIFEMGIVKMLMDSVAASDCCALYLAPTKSLCHERFVDWTRRFASLGLSTCQATGDSKEDDLVGIDRCGLIFSTPEKWDSMTRRFNRSNPLNKRLKLVMIDEVHIVSDKDRGPVLEAVVTRMKVHLPNVRFVAVSATIPNASDISDWLGTGRRASLAFSFDQSYRPVKLKTTVLEFYCSPAWTDFRFDISLNYKLHGVIRSHCAGKSTLVFCGTRKGTAQTAAVLAANLPIVPECQRRVIGGGARKIHDLKLRDLIPHGIAYHHAGLDMDDRVAVEDMFKTGVISILVATSTLAMGVNLPASAVVIKSTSYYHEGTHTDYNSSQLLQMVGRAGRPQFGETEAVVIIMAKAGSQAKYAAILNGSETVESSLHTQLVEHVNAEIVLGTIRDLADGVAWIQSTFMFVRLSKNPNNYKELLKSLGAGCNVEKSVKMLFGNCLQKLTDAKMVDQREDGLFFQSSELGMIMSKYCISFETMKKLTNLPKDTTMHQLLGEICKSSEIVSDIIVRNNEKAILNGFHVVQKSAKQKVAEGAKEYMQTTNESDAIQQHIRFVSNSKVKTSDMKCFTLIQACLGGLNLSDFALNQEAMRIMRVATRLVTALYESLMFEYGAAAAAAPCESSSDRCWKLLHNACLLMKSIKLRMWHDSQHVLKQFSGIGQTISNAFVNAGIRHLDTLAALDALRIEMIASRHPPFGHTLLAQVKGLPRLSISLELGNFENANNLSVTVVLLNPSCIGQTTRNQSVVVIITAAENGVLISVKPIRICNLLPGGSMVFFVHAKTSGTIKANLINLNVVGLDANCTITLPGTSESGVPPRAPTQTEQNATKTKRKNKKSKGNHHHHHRTPPDAAGKHTQPSSSTGDAKKRKCEDKIDDYLKPRRDSSLNYYFDHSIVWDEKAEHKPADKKDDCDLGVVDRSLHDMFGDKSSLEEVMASIPMEEPRNGVDDQFEMDDEDLIRCAAELDNHHHHHHPTPIESHADLLLSGISDHPFEEDEALIQSAQPPAQKSDANSPTPFNGPRVSQIYYGGCVMSEHTGDESSSPFGISRTDVNKELEKMGVGRKEANNNNNNKIWNTSNTLLTSKNNTILPNAGFDAGTDQKSNNNNNNNNNNHTNSGEFSNVFLSLYGTGFKF